MSDLYFDDFTVGRVIDTPGITVTESDIIDFAMRYDPQPFHLNREAAKESIFGELIASGFQTLCLSFRMFMETGVMRKCSVGGPGMDELRWLKPVKVGDTLRCRVTVAKQVPSRSKPDRGSVVWGFETLNQRGEVVMTAMITSILSKRPG